MSVCSSACGWCGRCTEDEWHAVERRCWGCGRYVWMPVTEEYTLQVYCERCQREEAEPRRESRPEVV